jgi:deoxyguanosine kinase
MAQLASFSGALSWVAQTRSIIGAAAAAATAAIGFGAYMWYARTRPLGRPAIVSIDGNIGAGKSTFVEKLKTYLADDPRYVFIQEPVREWESIQNADGQSMIELFYADKEKYAFSFQMMAYISRLAILRDAVLKAERTGAEYIISERCVDTDKHVFAKMLNDDGVLEDVQYAIYNRWYDVFLKELPVHARIYIDACAATCGERIAKRGRPGENIPIPYLKRCGEYHHSWLSQSRKAGIPVLYLDGESDIYDKETTFACWLKEVSSFLGDPKLVRKLTQRHSADKR